MTSFFVNISKLPVSFYEIGQSDNICNFEYGELGVSSIHEEIKFSNWKECSIYVKNEKEKLLKQGFFEAYYKCEEKDIFVDNFFGISIKIDFYTNSYTYKYVDSFDKFVLIFFDEDDRNRNIYKKFLENEFEVKNKIDLALFEHHKDEFADYFYWEEEHGIKDDYERFEKIYKPYGKITTYEDYKKLEIQSYQDMENEWEVINKVEDIKDKQKMLYKYIELNEIRIYDKIFENFDIGFGFNYEKFEEEHGLGIKLKNNEIVEVCSKNDI